MEQQVMLEGHEYKAFFEGSKDEENYARKGAEHVYFNATDTRWKGKGYFQKPEKVDFTFSTRDFCECSTCYKYLRSFERSLMIVKTEQTNIYWLDEDLIVDKKAMVDLYLESIFKYLLNCKKAQKEYSVYVPCTITMESFHLEVLKRKGIVAEKSGQILLPVE